MNCVSQHATDQPELETKPSHMLGGRAYAYAKYQWEPVQSGVESLANPPFAARITVVKTASELGPP